MFIRKIKKVTFGFGHANEAVKENAFLKYMKQR